MILAAKWLAVFVDVPLVRLMDQMIVGDILGKSWCVTATDILYNYINCPVYHPIRILFVIYSLRQFGFRI